MSVRVQQYTGSKKEMSQSEHRAYTKNFKLAIELLLSNQQRSGRKPRLLLEDQDAIFTSLQGKL